MTRRIPELVPRLDLDAIPATPKLGPAADLRALLALLKKLGVFGPESSSEAVARLIYRFRKTPERSEKADYRRLENILRGKPVTARELEFFRLCLIEALGDAEAGAAITDQDILSGHALMLLQRAATTAPRLDWTHLDPLNALLDLAHGAERKLEIRLVGPDTQYRWRRSKTGHRPKPQEPSGLILRPDQPFMLTFPGRQSRTPPLVLNYVAATTTSERAGIDLRAQVVPHVVRLDDGAGPWRVSEPNAQPMNVEPVPGRYGFLAIAEAGRLVERLFTMDFDPDALVGEDLAHLFEALTLMLRAETPPRIGVLPYEVRAD